MNRLKLVLFTFLTLLLFTPSISSAQRLLYSIDLRKAEEQKINVTVRPIGIKKERLIFQMPAWAPGTYAEIHFGKFVKNMKAKDTDGKELNVRKVNDDSWEIPDAENIGELSYTVQNSYNEAEAPYYALAQVNKELVYVNGPAVYGYFNNLKDAAATVNILVPEGWSLATPLDAATDGMKVTPETRFKQSIFTASTYDKLVDAPILAAPTFQTKSFKEGKTPYDIVVVSDRPFAMDSLLTQTRNIVRSQTSFFKSIPFQQYYFLFYAPTASKLPSRALGGISHENSSFYLVPNAGWSQFQNGSLPIVAREFFHTWTERKIHSAQMSTIDYTTPIKTKSLWLTDGITDYYAKLLPARYGFASPATFYNSVQTWHDMLQQEGSDLSLEQLSQEASSNDLERSRLFLSKAPLVALMMDIEIREKTKNRKSLDDVLIALYKNSRNGRTYNDKELVKTIENTVGVDLTEFYSKYIAGDEQLPLEEYLNKMGAASDLPEGLRPQADIGFDLALSKTGSIIVKDVRDTSSGLRIGDTISKLNDVVLDGKNITALMSKFKEGDNVRVTVVKNKKPKELAAVVKRKSAPKVGTLKVAPATKPNRSQLTLRKGIIGKRKLASLTKTSR